MNELTSISEMPAAQLHPHQEQLFNPDEAKEAQERQDRAVKAIAQLESQYPDLSHTDRVIQMQKKHQSAKPANYPAGTYQDALDLVENGELPLDLRLKRDYSDSLKTHEEKQAEHQDKLVLALTKKIADIRQTEEYSARHKEHNGRINAREKELAERRATRETFIARQKLIHGENRIKTIPGLEQEINAAADKHVLDVHGPGSENLRYGILDTADLKEPKQSVTDNVPGPSEPDQPAAENDKETAIT